MSKNSYRPRPRKIDVPLVDHDRRVDGVMHWDLSSGYTISRDPKERYVEMWQGDSLVASFSLSESRALGEKLYRSDDDESLRLRARALCSAAAF